MLDDLDFDAEDLGDAGSNLACIRVEVVRVVGAVVEVDRRVELAVDAERVPTTVAVLRAERGLETIGHGASFVVG
jgi:hypothetical protein